MPIYYAHSLEGASPPYLAEIRKASSVRGEACSVALRKLFTANPGATVQGCGTTWGKYQAEFQQKLHGSKMSQNLKQRVNGSQLVLLAFFVACSIADCDSPHNPT